MSDTSKKQTFLHGAALLAIATAIVKVIGALYKIPLNAILGEKGFGYFSSAYDVYSLLLMISTAGLPVAMSRMISQSATLGAYNQMRRTYRVSLSIFLILGAVSTLLMVGFSGFLAEFEKQPNARIAIICLGPCALLMGLISTFRGFFQGHGNMRPTSVSQVLEAACKLVIGLALAFFLMRRYRNVPLAAGGAIFGVTFSCMVSVVYLYRKFRGEYRQVPAGTDDAMSVGKTVRELLAIAVPITVGSAGLQFLTVLETRIYMGQLLTVLPGTASMAQDSADTMKGIYNMSQTIFNMPCAFIVPLAISMIPAVTSGITLKQDDTVRATEESAARITGLLSLPCSVGLVLLAKPIMALLGGYTGENLALGAKLMAVLGISVFLYAIIQVTNSLLQAHGYAYIPVINMLVAGTVKLAVVYILVGNPNIGILGAPIGAVLCYGAIAVMNLLSIAKVVPQKPQLLRNLLRSLLPALIMGVAVFLTNWVLARLLGENGSRLILCAVPIIVGGVVYLVSAVFCKSVTAEDCKLLPRGEKIAKLLKL